jgi:hypothetical protein
MLYNTGNVRTPLLSMIGGNPLYTNSVEFVLGQTYANEEGDIPNISEDASLTAPNPTYVTRGQSTNVTQIFHEALAISYAKQSNMGTLAGANLEGQTANPQSELDFQVARKMDKIARSIEKTFIQGTYNKATTDATVNKTRGLIQAITTNTIDLDGEALDMWAINDMLVKMKEHGADISNLTLWATSIQISQINGSAIEAGFEVGTPYNNAYGIRITDIICPAGTVHMAEGEFLPEGTALVLNIPAIHPVEQPVPGKGNFFLEDLAKTGAGEKKQIFGQIGLDYGMEFLHGKFTGIKTTFTKPLGRKVVTVAEV